MARVTPSSTAPPPAPRSDFGKKVLAHTRYYLDNGRQAPGVTTILGVLAKPALVPWANKLGLQGISTDKYVDEAAAIGSLAHYLVQCRLTGEVPQLDDYTPAQVERAKVSFGSWERWYRSHTFLPSLVEEVLVSNLHGFGGTIDSYGLLDGVPVLIDCKTSTGIYPEHIYQVSAYWKLLEEHGHPVKGVRILRIPRNEGDGLDEKVLTGQQVLHGWEVFQHCQAIYELRKKERAA